MTTESTTPTPETAENVESAPEAVENSATHNGEAAYQELNQQYLRLAADFDNFRKRINAEREDLLKYGALNTVLQLLPVLDNLQRANSSLSEQSDPKTLLQSVKMMQSQLLDSLKGIGLKPIDSVGQAFDPERHEAITQQPSNEYPDNTVMQVYQEGFMLHERVIRPAQVVVSTGPASNEQSANPFQQAAE